MRNGVKQEGFVAKKKGEGRKDTKVRKEGGSKRGEEKCVPWERVTRAVESKMFENLSFAASNISGAQVKHNFA